ncbi:MULTISPECIES: hypothetical protein [Bacillus cereus group]|uniref:hypothetical protein n=1 Tax=Bacillus cereus group TaxID=86661 RepID=UPI0012393B39|nr:hypothetical protein [Bacillus cereus]KAA6470366.1 hypothetical protein DX931_28400 [Bacillus cereus]KAB2429181.1 hypothetical protein F8168_14410 [Bacillus cereus]
MESNTKQFISDIQQRNKNYIVDALKAIQHPEKEQTEQIIQNILKKMNMMINLVTTYMEIETESTKELKKLQEEIIHAQEYIQKRKFEETQR